jgi:hypothetical protein
MSCSGSLHFHWTQGSKTLHLKMYIHPTYLCAPLCFMSMQPNIPQFRILQPQHFSSRHLYCNTPCRSTTESHPHNNKQCSSRHWVHNRRRSLLDSNPFHRSKPLRSNWWYRNMTPRCHNTNEYRRQLGSRLAYPSDIVRHSRNRLPRRLHNGCHRRMRHNRFRQGHSRRQQLWVLVAPKRAYYCNIGHFAVGRSAESERGDLQQGERYCSWGTSTACPSLGISDRRAEGMSIVLEPSVQKEQARPERKLSS